MQMMYLVITIATTLSWDFILYVQLKISVNIDKLSSVGVLWQTVEEASTRALDATFGTQHSRHHGRKQAVTAVQDVRNLDAAYTEGRCLTVYVYL